MQVSPFSGFQADIFGSETLRKGKGQTVALTADAVADGTVRVKNGLGGSLNRGPGCEKEGADWWGKLQPGELAFHSTLAKCQSATRDSQRAASPDFGDAHHVTAC